MKKTAVCAAALFASVAAWGADYYVDANHGDDAWDGTTAAIPAQETIDQCAAQGEPVPGPRRTLHAMMSDERVIRGDVVNAAEGDYNEGGVPTSATGITTNRVMVKAGVTLRATGAREATFITGSGGSGDAAYTNGAVRCVSFIAPPNNASYGYGIVKRFTLREGRTGSPNEHGGAASGAGLLVECDFVNNGCQHKSRGGTLYRATALRCRFVSNNRAFLMYYTSVAIDSLFDTSAVNAIYSSGKAYNCTFLDNTYPKFSSVYNCLFIGTGAASNNQSDSGGKKSHYYNTLSRSNFNIAKCTTNGTCRVVSADASLYSAETIRPLAESAAIDAGDPAYYAAATNGWKAAWRAECGKDYYGGVRVAHGRIDVGCGEAQTEGDVSLAISDESDGLVVEGAAVGTATLPQGAPLVLTFSRNFDSERLCTGVMANGVFHSFGGTTSDVPYVVTLPMGFAFDYTFAAVYETNQTDWYVSPTGNDSNKGYHRNCPRRTLVQAMALASKGHVVHAAAGVYNEGIATHYVASYGTQTNRVVVDTGIGLVADEWPLAETVIEGAASTSPDADENGNGPGAFRCAYVRGEGYIKGFKLTGGHTDTSSGVSQSLRNGGAAYLVGSAALIGCEVTGNSCQNKGGGVFGSLNSKTYPYLIGCHVHDNVDPAGRQTCTARVVNSRVEGLCDCDGATFVLNSQVTQVRRGAAVNSHLAQALYETACTNCVFTLSADAAMEPTEGHDPSYDPGTCLFSIPFEGALDADFRPPTADSPLVDAGSWALYEAYFPAKWTAFKDLDYAGGQRVYNAQIDVGIGEYDPRADFAPLLGADVAVRAMGPGVTTNDAPRVVVPADGSITLARPAVAPGEKTRYGIFYTTPEGTRKLFSKTVRGDFEHTLDGPCTVEELRPLTLGVTGVVR